MMLIIILFIFNPPIITSGKRLILWDEAKKAWRNITVEDFVVRWVDNGLTAIVTHLVQEYTEAFEPITVPKEVNLSLFKWFQSPVQEIDAQTVKRNREKKRWEDAIADIDSVALKEIEMLKYELEDYRRSQEQLFKRSKKRIMKAFERTLMQRAKDTADSSIATRALKVHLITPPCLSSFILSSLMSLIERASLINHNNNKKKNNNL